MKRTPLKRKTLLRANAKTTQDWKDRSKKALPKFSTRRRTEEAAYRRIRESFLRFHAFCPVTGGRTTQIHHSARRRGEWLNLRRYWIAMSAEGHLWVEENSKEAESFSLMFRCNQTYEEHIKLLKAEGVDLDEPVFYRLWKEYSDPILPTSYGR